MRIVEENWKSHVVVSHRVAANRVAVRCGRAIARVSIAWRAIAHADAIVREPGKTGSQWRILYSIRLPGLVCDFFEGTATIGEGSGESLKRLPVGPQELILADADYCSVAGIEYVWQHGADVLVRLNRRVSWRTQHAADVSPSFHDYVFCPKRGSSANGGLSCRVKVRGSQAGCVQYERATARFNRRIGACSAKRVRSK